MSSRATWPGERSVEPVRRALLDEATRLFAEKGFDATSVQDVVDAAGVTKGAFYYYFSSKNHVLYEIHEWFMAAALDHVARIVGADLPPEEALRAMIVALIEDVATYQNGVIVFFREMHRLLPDHRAAIHEERKRFEGYFQAIIEQGQAEGSFQATIPGHLQTIAILTMCQSVSVWYRPNGPMTPQQIGEAFADLLLSGIRTTNLARGADATASLNPVSVT
jgi:AcrR family transcriptional regulator